MALADTKRAIGAVSRLLRDRLVSSAITPNVTVGRTEPPAGTAHPRLNLFLYEINVDGSLRNYALDEGQPTPIWLALRYVLTAFDTDGESDTMESQEFLGAGMQALQDLNYLSLAGLAGDTIKALDSNPEPLKLTFDEASHELLSKLMQGTDEKYRCSAAFQVRPVMIASTVPPAYSLLVGVDYTRNIIIGEKGVGRFVLPSLGPSISSVSPDSFEVGTDLTVFGTDLNLSNLAVRLGPVTLAVSAQQTDRLVANVPAALGSGTAISAGSQPVSVAWTLPNGRVRSSNVLTADLTPQVTGAALSGMTRVPPGGPTDNVFGDVDITGTLLGLPADDVFLAFLSNGTVVRMTDNIVPPVGPPPPPQTQVRFRLTQATAIPPGMYNLIVRVNGQQARSSPLVNWVA